MNDKHPMVLMFVGGTGLGKYIYLPTEVGRGVLNNFFIPRLGLQKVAKRYNLPIKSRVLKKFQNPTPDLSRFKLSTLDLSGVVGCSIRPFCLFYMGCSFSHGMWSKNGDIMLNLLLILLFELSEGIKFTKYPEYIFHDYINSKDSQLICK